MLTLPSGYIAVFLLFGYIHFIIAFLRRDIKTTSCGAALGSLGHQDMRERSTLVPSIFFIGEMG